MNPMAVPKEDFDYFDSLLELRRQEVERQNTKSYDDYVPPNYNDFKVWKGVEKISSVMKKLHPAYEVFMEWREGELIKENIEAERRWAWCVRLHGQPEFFWDRIQSLKGSTARRDYANCDHHKDPRITASESYYDLYAGLLYGENYEYYFDKFGKKQDRHPIMLKGYERKYQCYQSYCEEKIKNYKKRAHAIRLLQRKDEIRKDAKTVFGSCGDSEDVIADHLDSLYGSVHHNPVNCGCRSYDDVIEGWWYKWADHFSVPNFRLTLLYSDIIRHNPRDFPTLTTVEQREATKYEGEGTPDSIEFSSNLLLTHRNLPIP